MIIYSAAETTCPIPAKLGKSVPYLIPRFNVSDVLAFSGALRIMETSVFKSVNVSVIVSFK